MSTDSGEECPLRIAVVGPCAAGKSTLTRKLRALGYQVNEPAQEHSYVPDMWWRLTRPDVLIYLDVELPTVARRRHIAWGQDYLNELKRRLRHARLHAHLYVPTDDLTPEQVIEHVQRFLDSRPASVVSADV